MKHLEAPVANNIRSDVFEVVVEVMQERLIREGGDLNTTSWKAYPLSEVSTAIVVDYFL